MKQKQAGVPVTAHAALRWLERVEGFDLGAIRKDMAATGDNPENDGAVLFRFEQSTGMTKADIAKQMLTPVAEQAIRLGAVMVRVGKALLVIEEGSVVSVKTVSMRHRGLNYALDRYRKCAIANAPKRGRVHRAIR